MSDATTPSTPSVPPVPGAPVPPAPGAPVPPVAGAPAPRFGEFAPVESTQAPASAAPGQPTMYSGVPATPAAAPQYAQPQAAQPQYAQPVYGQPGFGVAAPAPKRRTWDVVLTIILLVLGLGGMLLGVLYGVLFSSPELIDQAFREQGLGGFSGEIGAAPIVIIASHVILYLLAAGLSILLLVKRKIAFYVPLIAGVVAAIIFWTSLVMLMLSDPSFTATYGA